MINRDRIILPPLHIKLGLMKQFVKALDKDGNCFNYITKTFPSFGTDKPKASIFDGPQIRNRDLEAEAVLFLWKRKREKPAASASS